MVVFLQGGYVQFNLSESKTIRLELIGDNFISGECFGDSSGFHFVYVDEQEGTFVLDLTTFNFTQLSTQQPCFNNNLKCTPVQVLDSQYLVVQQWENHENFTDSNNNTALRTTVFDAQDNFQIVSTISEMNSSTRLISIIVNNLTSCPSTGPMVDTTTETSIVTNTEVASTIPTIIESHTSNKFDATSFNSEVTLAIGVGVAGLVLIMLLITVIILIIIILFVRHTENKSNCG